MAFNLKGRSCLKIADFSQREMLYLLELARAVKRAKYARSEHKALVYKNICLIFEKSSTRTRCALRWRPMITARTSLISIRQAARSATRNR
jgi:ornithine carbamoyltransferase